MKKYIIPIILAIVIILLVVKGIDNGTFKRFEAKLIEAKQDFTSDMKQTKSEVKENVVIKTEDIKEKVIPKEDQLIKDCKDSFKECKNIGIKKYGWSISLSEIEKFDDKEGIEEFYNTWSMVLGLFSTRQEELELDYPIVLFAFSIKKGENQLPDIVVCEDGELTESSKRRLGCG